MASSVKRTKGLFVFFAPAVLVLLVLGPSVMLSFQRGSSSFCSRSVLAVLALPAQGGVRRVGGAIYPSALEDGPVVFRAHRTSARNRLKLLPDLPSHHGSTAQAAALAEPCD